MANYTADQLTQTSDPNLLAIAGAPFGGGNSLFATVQQIVAAGLQSGGGIPAVSTTGAGYSVWVGAQSAGGSSGAGGDYNILLAAQNTSGGNGSFKIWDTTGATALWTFDNTGTIAYGTITTSQPFSVSQTWNAGGVTFTGLKVNATDTASASGSLLVDMQVGGTSVASIDKTGNIVNKNGNFVFRIGNASGMAFSTQGLEIGQNMPIWWLGSGAAGQNNGATLTVYQDASDILAQRRSTNAQTFRVYNTYTDASNYERGFVRWATNVLEIGTEGSGTGTDDRVFRLLRGANSKIELSNAGGVGLYYSGNNYITVGNNLSLRSVSGNIQINASALSFFGVSAVARPATGGASSTIVSGSGTAGKQDDTYDGYTLAQVVKALRNLGLLT